MDTHDPKQPNLPNVLPSQPRVAPSAESETPISETSLSVELTSSDLQKISEDLYQIELIARNLTSWLTLEFAVRSAMSLGAQSAIQTLKSLQKSEPSGSTSSTKGSSQTPILDGYCDQEHKVINTKAGESSQTETSAGYNNDPDRCPCAPDENVGPYDPNDDFGLR